MDPMGYMYEYSSATRHQSQPLSRSAFHVMIFQVALCCRRWTVTLRNVPSSAVPWQIGFQHVNVPTTSPPTAPSFWTGEAIVDGKARPVFKDPVTDQGDCDRIWLVEWCCDGVLVCFKLNVFVGVFFHFGWQRRAFRMPCEARSPNRAGWSWWSATWPRARGGVSSKGLSVEWSNVKQKD